MGKTYCVYIAASSKLGAIYTGVTNDLVRRMHEHREGLVDGHTKRYGIKHLVWFEVHEDIGEAILREKRIKEWSRAWRVRLIAESNPDWRDCGGRLPGRGESVGGGTVGGNGFG